MASDPEAQQHRRTMKREERRPARSVKPESRRFQTGEQRRFELMVRQAVDGLPRTFLDILGDVPVTVEDEPSAEELAGTDSTPGETLFGLYQGIPLTERLSGYGMELPDKITIYRIPIEEENNTRREVIAEVQRTIIHELAHHFGISEERLTELGWD